MNESESMHITTRFGTRFATRFAALNPEQACCDPAKRDDPVTDRRFYVRMSQTISLTRKLGDGHLPRLPWGKLRIPDTLNDAGLRKNPPGLPWGSLGFSATPMRVEKPEALWGEPAGSGREKTRSLSWKPKQPRHPAERDRAIFALAKSFFGCGFAMAGHLAESAGRQIYGSYKTLELSKL